jgi:hypothetical protein
MSESGQTEKNSVRANVFRFALELGHCSTQSACLKGATIGSRRAHSITASATASRFDQRRGYRVDSGFSHFDGSVLRS